MIALTPVDLVPAIYLCTNSLGPAYEGIELGGVCLYVDDQPMHSLLGIGDSILMKGIAEATGRSLQQIKSDMVEEGDLGMMP